MRLAPENLTGNRSETHDEPEVHLTGLHRYSNREACRSTTRSIKNEKEGSSPESTFTFTTNGYGLDPKESRTINEVTGYSVFAELGPKFLAFIQFSDRRCYYLAEKTF